jgi:hypothetical protein
MEWSLRSYRAWNLDEQDDSRPVRRQAHEYAELFLAACRTWGAHADSHDNLVSLSGGRDSRAVVAGLARAGIGVAAVTYRDPNGRREDEVRCARQLAGVLDVEWHCLDLPAPAESAYEELAWLKDGMNWSSITYILSYLEAIVERWGQGSTYWSGDGGDDCLKVTAPGARFSDVEEVVSYVLKKETGVRPDHAEAILKLPTGTLRAELQALLESYPERDLAQRIKHFRIFERGRRAYFEGEDRTRSFLWQDSPFYSLCPGGLLGLPAGLVAIPALSSGQGDGARSAETTSRTGSTPDPPTSLDPLHGARGIGGVPAPPSGQRHSAGRPARPDHFYIYSRAGAPLGHQRLVWDAGLKVLAYNARAPRS